MSLKAKIFTSLAAVVIASTAMSQQDPQFSMNMNNKLFVNPGYAGMNDGICAYTIGRQQWVGFEGRPETYLFGAHGTFIIPGIDLRSGAGLTVVGDGLGQMHFTGLKAMYSAHIPLNIIASDPGYLGIGLSGGMLQYGIGSNWRSSDEYWKDPTIPDGGFQLSKFDMEAGIFYQTEKLYFGASMSHLNGASFEADGTPADPNNPDATNWNTSFKMQSHLFIQGGYDFYLPNPMFVLKPSIFLKSDLVTAQYDVNCLLEYNTFVWGGLTYRYIDAVAVMAGVNYSPTIMPGAFRFGYAYDVTTNKLTSGSNGSHEIFVQYCLKLKKKAPVQKHKSVRFL